MPPRLLTFMASFYLSALAGVALLMKAQTWQAVAGLLFVEGLISAATLVTIPKGRRAKWFHEDATLLSMTLVTPFFAGIVAVNLVFFWEALFGRFSFVSREVVFAMITVPATGLITVICTPGESIENDHRP